MKPFNDEINDALRRKLRSSLEDFESKPDAAFDRKMYKLLKKTPSWRTASVWILAGVLLFCGAVLLSYEMFLSSDKTASRSANSRSKVVKVEGHRSFGRQTNVQGKPQPSVTAIRDKPGTNPDQKNGKQNAGPLPTRRVGIFSGTTAGGSSVHLPEDSIREPQIRATEQDLPVNGAIIHISEQKPVVVQEKGNASRHEKQEAVPEHLLHTATADVGDLETATVRDIKFAGLAERGWKLLTPATPVQYMHQLTLPAILYTSRKPAASFVKAHETKIRRRHYIDWAEAGKLSFIFNATSFQSVQQVKILPRSESRIQDVAFPQIFSALGYKLGAGAEKHGFQLTANFSRINTQLGYAFASDDYKIVETAPNEYQIRRLTNKWYHSRSVNLVGLGIKKQIDFKSRLFGQLYSNVGAEYTKTLSPGSRGFLFANVSSGKRFTLNSSLSVSVGPYFEYCFGKMNAADGQIGIRPSQIGLLLGWKFSKVE